MIWNGTEGFPDLYFLATPSPFCTGFINTSSTRPQSQHSVTSPSNSLANVQQPQRLQHESIFNSTSIKRLTAAETILHDPIESRNLLTASSATPHDAPTLRQRHCGCTIFNELLLHHRCLHDIHTRVTSSPITWQRQQLPTPSTSAATPRQRQQTDEMLQLHPHPALKRVAQSQRYPVK